MVRYHVDITAKSKKAYDSGEDMRWQNFTDCYYAGEGMKARQVAKEFIANLRHGYKWVKGVRVDKVFGPMDMPDIKTVFVKFRK